MPIVRTCVLLVFMIIWGSGVSTTVSLWLDQLGLISDDYQFGDLYQFSALPQFKQERSICKSTTRSSDTARTHLYIIGDSFTRPDMVNKSDFRVSHYQRIDWNLPPLKKFQLNRAKRNILLIETVERHFQQRFAWPITDFYVEKDTANLHKKIPTLTEWFTNEFHRSKVEERLESTLFNHRWLFKLQELKASLSLSWFDRTDWRVSLSKDKRHLFVFMETDKNLPQTSSFSTLADSEIDKFVSNVNVAAKRYRNLGFDEVYLSIIPSKASILETNRSDYNHLIERIQNAPQLNLPIINTYTVYKESSVSPYLKSDTHWNCEGRSMWLNLVQNKLGI